MATKMRSDWQIRPGVPEEIEENLVDFTPLTQSLLFARGISSREEAEQFLAPRYERDIHDPFLASDMEKAVSRIVRAIMGKERIVIFGDYDADGIPGAALLHSFLRKINYENFSVYIPDRYEEKYGLSVPAIEQFDEEGTQLVITVDCGITDFEPARRAKELGIDLIITDHHLPHGVLPDAFAIINHKKEDDTYPFKYLCGAGTAWKLAQALATRPELEVPTGYEKWLLELAAISTVCDMVPLEGENRAIVHFGLRVLRQTRRPGLLALFRKARLNPQAITEDDIGFTIGPRINIASRMSHGKLAFELLTTEDPVRARILADTLEKYNFARKGLVEDIIDEVRGGFSHEEPVLFAGNPAWRLGILSATANRLLEEFERPVCLWSRNARGEIKGSIRSDGTVHILELFEAVGGRDLFIDYGGHEHSGGFSILEERIPIFRDRLITAYQSICAEKVGGGRVIDAILELPETTLPTIKEINRFGPFGKDNPKPIFIFRNLTIENVRVFGRSGVTHLEITLGNEEVTRKAIAFRTRPEIFGDLLREGESIDLVGTLEHSTWNGRSDVRLRIVDILPR